MNLRRYESRSLTVGISERLSAGDRRRHGENPGEWEGGSGFAGLGWAVAREVRLY
jgi:hypothetical protein